MFVDPPFSNPNEPPYCPIQEAHFDSAITVQDSFYVSYYTDNCSYMHNQILDQGLVSSNNVNGFRIAGGAHGDNGNINWVFVVGDWENGVFILHLPYLFPIIDTTDWNYIPPCDTMTCANTSGFHVATQTGRFAALMWVGAPEQTDWEVSYGPIGTAPENGRVISTTMTSATISNLDTGRHYVAYVRGFCPQCKVWSEWSDGVEFWVGMNDPVEIASTVEQLTYIAPNPAHDMVQVFSSFGIRKVGIFNAQGKQVAARQVSDYSTTLDIGTLAAGLYFISIHTPAGTVTKKLVVE